jgi:hypothetical protein
MILPHRSERTELKLSSDYKQLQGRINESIKKEEARQKILQAKREEKRAIKKAGGGKAIAKSILGGNMAPDDTDFNFGNNSLTNVPPPSDVLDGGVESEDIQRCMGPTVCQKCGRFHGYCSEVQEDKEKLKMLPTGNEAQQSGRKKQGAMKWIKSEDLSVTPKEAKILMVRYNKEGRFGSRVELKLAFEGQIAYFGVPPNKETTNYALLLDKFGPDENEWVDQRILLFLEKDKFSEQYYIRVDFPKAKK